MTIRYCKQCRGWHDVDAPWPAECYVPQTYARSSLKAPYIIQDGLDYVQSMADGKRYTSKSQLRASYKALGVEEVGNDPGRHKKHVKPKPDRKKIREAIQRAKSRAGLGA